MTTAEAILIFIIAPLAAWALSAASYKVGAYRERTDLRAMVDEAESRAGRLHDDLTAERTQRRAAESELAHARHTTGGGVEVKHIVMFSGGLGSWLAARRVRDLVGTDDLILLFADVASGRSPHVGEDEDAYRFIHEAALDVLGELRMAEGFVTVSDGRDIWEVFQDDRFLGNTRLANCSKFLKQKPCREWLEANYAPNEAILYVGIDWTESQRLPAILEGWAPYLVRAPLTDRPYLDRDDMQRLCVEAGIELPRLYRAGFPHNNCGGFCVRAGQAQMELLLREHPERYAFHEAEEQELREYLAKDVSILRDRTGGTLTPLTLTRFRERLEDQPDLFDGGDFGGCGCFTEATA